MSLQERWEGLSPTLRRGLVLGGATVVLIGLASLLVSAPKDERAAGADERRRLITHLLTEADLRAIGIEGLAERLWRLETHMGQLAAGLDKLGLTKGADPERDALIARLRQENARELQELRRQQGALREQLAAGRTTPAPPAALPTEKPSPPPRAQRPLSQLFDPAREPQPGPAGMACLPGVGSEPAHGAKALTLLHGHGRGDVPRDRDRRRTLHRARAEPRGDPSHRGLGIVRKDARNPRLSRWPGIGKSGTIIPCNAPPNVP
jgi:hypothetical protein